HRYVFIEMWRLGFDDRQLAMVFMIGFVSTIFCGHLGKTELASVALAIATYGSGNLMRVGVILQRGVLILLLACFPCWAVLLNTEVLLLLFKQSPDVSNLFYFIFVWVNLHFPIDLQAAFMYTLQARYLQNQGIIWPQVITGAIGNILNAIINYVFLFPLDLGVAGSAAANSISQYMLAIFLFVYIHVRGLHKATWSGWSLECLQEWGSFVMLAIPSMFMLCLEWWMFEIGAFLAGIISEVELGSQSVVYQLAVVAYMIPLGLSAAASVRVGNALGAGNVEQAKLSAKVPIVSGSLMMALKGYLAYIFTTEQDIIDRVSDVVILFSFAHLGDAVAGVAGGVVRGAGKQKYGALTNLVGFYFIGSPIGISLMFAANMGIIGKTLSFYAAEQLCSLCWSFCVLASSAVFS
uniref:Solute carrier family 47 member 2.1 n=1 Tax=Neogobius melanostomus TaxID=47308 RepID=A0A8C6T3Y7_9GOBI